MTPKEPALGKCCSCGYTGHEETDCPSREDQIHCVHWWDGPEVMVEAAITEEREAL